MNISAQGGNQLGHGHGIELGALPQRPHRLDGSSNRLCTRGSTRVACGSTSST
jgi:hypothetical protein